MLIMCNMGPAERAKARAMEATARDIEAQREAINLQESSAIMFERVHQPNKSRNARERAEHAREGYGRQLRSGIELILKPDSTLLDRAPDQVQGERRATRGVPPHGQQVQQIT
jgi:hypothetical protein